MDAIKQTISTSKENYECAVAIEKALIGIREQKNCKIYSTTLEII